MMERFILKALIAWKTAVSRKPLNLRSYREKCRPPRQALRFSMRNLKQDGGVPNIPLSLIPHLRDFLPDEA